MAFKQHVDYTVAFSAKQIVDRVIFIGTKNYLITVPIKLKEGAGFTITTTTFSLGNLSMEQAVLKILNSQDIDEEKLIEIIKDLAIPKTTIINIKDLEAFKVNNKWLNRGVLYKPAGTNKKMGGWKPLCQSIDKEVIKDILNFYKTNQKLIK